VQQEKDAQYKYWDLAVRRTCKNEFWLNTVVKDQPTLSVLLEEVAGSQLGLARLFRSRVRFHFASSFTKPANGAEPEQDYLYPARGHCGKRDKSREYQVKSAVD
jgi:hypothetical protein